VTSRPTRDDRAVATAPGPHLSDAPGPEPVRRETAMTHHAVALFHASSDLLNHWPKVIVQ
jgi:hypothetical protein